MKLINACENIISYEKCNPRHEIFLLSRQVRRAFLRQQNADTSQGHDGLPLGEFA